jgi:twitching motility protein PilT
MLPLFGKIALQRGFLTQEQLDALLDLHGRGEGAVVMGELAIRAGYLAREQVEAILSQQVLEARRERDRTAAMARGQAPRPPRGDEPSLVGLLRTALARGVSDLHLHVGLPPLIRMHGQLAALRGAPLDAASLRARVAVLIPDAGLERWAEGEELEFARDVAPDLRVRASLYLEHRGPAASFRLIPSPAPGLQDLRLPPVVARLVTYPQGLVLLAGPGGCGKSTTLAALVGLINEERAHNVITVEDPVEHVHQSRRSTILQREVGPHTLSFAAALRAALREDPDVIVVGELRDREAIALAVSAAETGHLVLGTLTTRDCTESVARIVDVFPSDQQPLVRGMLANSLRGVLSQRLVVSRAGGRVPVTELLFHNGAVATCIRENRLHQLPSVMQTHRGQGMRRLEDSARELLAEGLVEASVLAPFLAGQAPSEVTA